MQPLSARKFDGFELLSGVREPPQPHVRLPQPVCIQMIRTGAVALGNLMLDVSRASGFYPDIVMGYPEPL